jgi:hypothetical protein
MKKINFLLLVIILFSGHLLSQTTVKVDLMKGSWLSINGTTNVLSFKLVQRGEKLLNKPITITATQTQNKIYLSQNQLVINVKNFSSDNPMALRDFQKLIKSDSYPSIKVQLNHIETLPDNNKELYSKVNASVNITITGVTHQYNIPVTSTKKGDSVSLKGIEKISIRDFGLQPPIEMMGLIKVSEWISIDFQMTCKLTVGKENTLALSSSN